ncbi:MAG: hypothetical protein M3433_02520 [Actinomycetota bacterium]|nr:hypothetical protein [Actinomycetota bacterium]MDQ3647457.1 hypothetical protein [Actinomycetota bacterium]
MSGNGYRTPPRPRIELQGSSATPEEAAAIAAAIEQFLRDTAPPPAPTSQDVNPWLRAGLLEGSGRNPHSRSPWGEREKWGL